MDDLEALQAGESVGMLHVSCTELQSTLLGTLHKWVMQGGGGREGGEGGREGGSGREGGASGVVRGGGAGGART